MEAKKFLVLQLLAVACYAQNIDILQPILRESPDPFQNGSLFGYSLALHQIAAPGSTPAQAMSSTRLVVSAPKRSTVGGQVSGTGAVYLCPVNPGPCVRSVNDRLYDVSADEGSENKTNQFLGASMTSNGENLVVCAHRYNFGTSRSMTGRCFASSNRDLSSFSDFQPCREVDSLGISSAGFCQVGISSVILPGPVYGLGAPGYYGWRGNLISMTSNQASDIQGLNFGEGTTGSINYLGYATTSGFFSDTTKLDYAVSVPRFGLYTGAVHIIVRDSSLTLVSQPALRGVQMGEGYGFSVLGVNLAGDGYSELLVGAPFYRANGTQADAGRVFVYSNNGGSLSLLRTIEGFQAFTRFGYAMASLGDINGDGFDDIAIGAPFSSTGESGTVYIYHSSSSQGLTLNFQQAIVGSKLSLTGVSPITGFGAALTSGIDVDGNTYNDLAIGAFESQKVFILRTRPIAQTTVSFNANPKIVDLEAMNCPLDGQMYACFVITACAEYSGSGLNDQLTYVFNLTADVRSIEKRIIFNNTAATILDNVNILRSSRVCRDYTAYVVNGIADKFNPFIVDFVLTVPPPVINEGDGNLAIQSFSDYPVVQFNGIREVQVETLKDCNGTVCIPDLRIRVLGTSTTKTDGSVIADSDTITVGGVRSVQIKLEVVNAAEDAFQGSVTITIPSQLQFGRVTGTFSNGGTETLTCSVPVREDTGGTSRSSCSIGNPFEGPNNKVIVTATVMPQNTLTGNEGNLAVSFSASSINPESNMTANDGSNMASTTLKIVAEADITIDTLGIVSPEQLTYSRTAPNGTITSVDQLGPRFSVSFVVRNSGPSTVRNIRLVINWPLNGSNTDSFYYLYPAQFSTSETGSTITCSNQNINPDRKLSLADGNDQQNSESTNNFMGNNRRKRSANHSIRKRQNIAVPADSATNTPEQSTVNRTISCADSGAVLNCIPIECTIIGLQGTSNAQARVNIIGYIDERFFSKSVDRFSIVPNASISIIGDEFITQPNPTAGKTATATIRLIPAAVVTVGARRAVPWWAIFLPIVAALIIIVVVAVILWALGFFKRRKHEEIKQKREELDNLEEHGITGGVGGSTDNIIAS